jgi:hypothetical protein
MTGDSFEKVKKGFSETAEGVKEGLEDTGEAVKEGFEETGEAAKDTVERATDSDTYTGNEDPENKQYNESGGKEPMNPEDIPSHEPTAVKRDKNQGTSGDPV